jgi:hypothetical protein
MLEIIVGLFWMVALSYTAAGLIFAIPFVLFWAGRIDTAAQHGSWGFRLAILPGVIALWPLMALKALRALRHSYSSPDPEQPVAPSMQRQIHGIAFVALAALVPVVCTAALLSRPRIESSIARQLQPMPLPQVVPLEIPAPNNLPIKAALRTDGSNYQFELEVFRAFDEPVVALYWSRETETHGLADKAIFLGSVWGPSRLLFNLPLGDQFVSGVLTFMALTGNQRVLATLPVSSR